MPLRGAPPGIPNWLYIAVVISLGLYFNIGAVAWAILAYEGRTLPDSFATILATIAGGLVGVLTGAGGARGRQDQSEQRDQ